MSNTINPRQRQILDLFLKNRIGLCIDEIATSLNISRSAVQQQLSFLERDGYIQTGGLKKTAGRPIRTFILTELGINFFPKQYAWFSDLILSNLKNELGSDAFVAYLQKLGGSLAQSLLSDFEGKQTDERIEKLIKTMEGLGFQATAIAVDKKKEETDYPNYITARNCIYHDVAQKHPEICELDKVLIATLLGKKVDLTECMAKGEHICRFKIKDN
jgi:predicted ArsR family transcriptional regulator